MSKKQHYVAIGLMSGTSADGVDAALITTDGEDFVDFHGGVTLHYDEELRSRVLDASQHNVPLEELLRLERDLTLFHVDAVAAMEKQLGAKAAAATVIGFHGHTVRHIPGEGITIQLGNPWLLADRTGKPVVSDFRRRDMAKGGQGAPLVSLFHQALFRDSAQPTVVLNLGGVANVTWLGPDGTIIAGDSGPGCGLLDEWSQEMAGLSHDINGQLALKGKVREEIVRDALSAEFFQKPLPRSADRFEFDHVDVSGLSVEDGAATLCAVTVEAIANAVALTPGPPAVLWVTGGGVHHPVIMQMLADRFDEVRTIDERGLSPDTLEAECFAWLAVRHHRGLPLSIPETTGCSEPTTGGFLSEP